VTLEQDGRDYEIYLFRWRRAGDYEAAADSFARCVGDHAAENSAVNVEMVDLSPWRAYGAGWSDELRRAVDGALRAAGGGT
jgi:hypothetical protein